MDEAGLFGIELQLGRGSVRARVVSDRRQNRFRRVHADIPEGLMLRIGKDKVVFKKAANGIFEAAIGNKPGAHLMDISLYGVGLGQYKITNKSIVATKEPKLFSRFHLRQITWDAVNSTPLRSNNYTPRENYALLRWLAKPILVDPKSPYRSKVDLHSHLGGALPTADFLRIAKRLRVRYPTSLLDRLRIPYNRSKVRLVNGEPTVHMRSKADRRGLVDRLEALPKIVSSDEHLEGAYALRALVTKNPKAFALVLEAIAKNYAKLGVQYAELSFFSIIKPEFYEIANKLIPELEKRHKVKLRFLVGLNRHSSKQTFKRELAQTKRALKKTPYILGVDFHKQESNRTEAFSYQIKAAASLRKRYPSFVVRVHAGESPCIDGNILAALKAGATRIGHGIYGLNDAVLKLAKEKDAIIEMNLNSNLALHRVHSTDRAIPIKRYLDAGVRVTISMDGHSLFQTTPASEEAAARAMGVTNRDFGKIAASDRAYLEAAGLSAPDRIHRRRKGFSFPLRLPTLPALSKEAFGLSY